MATVGKQCAIGQEVEEKTLALSKYSPTGCWQLDGNADEMEITERRSEILDVLADMGEAQVDSIAQAISLDRGNTYHVLQDLVSGGLVVKIKRGKNVFYTPLQTTGTTDTTTHNKLL